MGYGNYLRRVSSEEATHVSLANPKGCFVIYDKTKYLAALSKGRCKTCLVPRPLSGGYRSLQGDVDFRIELSAGEGAIPSAQVLLRFLNEIAPLACAQFGPQEAVLSAKPPYECELARLGKVVKSGFHIQMPKCIVRPPESLSFREKIRNLQSETFQIYTNMVLSSDAASPRL